MNAYFIDYENVHEKGLEGIENLQSDDKLFIFFNPNDKFPMKYLKEDTRDKIIFMESYVGSKNAIDFQIATFLGYTISKNEFDKYIIISKDNGYAPMIDFWHAKGHSVKIESSILEAKNTNVCKQSYTLDAAIKTVNTIYRSKYPTIKEEDIKIEMNIIKKAIITHSDDSKILAEIKKGLDERYETQTATQHYKTIKKCVKDMRPFSTLKRSEVL